MYHKIKVPSHNHAQLPSLKQILTGHWTVKLGRQNGRLLHWTCSEVQLCE